MWRQILYTIHKNAYFTRQILTGWTKRKKRIWNLRIASSTSRNAKCENVTGRCRTNFHLFPFFFEYLYLKCFYHRRHINRVFIHINMFRARWGECEWAPKRAEKTLIHNGNASWYECYNDFFFFYFLLASNYEIVFGATRKINKIIL